MFVEPCLSVHGFVSTLATFNNHTPLTTAGRMFSGQRLRNTYMPSNNLVVVFFLSVAYLFFVTITIAAYTANLATILVDTAQTAEKSLTMSTLVKNKGTVW